METKTTIMVKKPQLLTKYGFIETNRQYELKIGCKTITVWKKARNRVENQLVFTVGQPIITNNLIVLFVNLYNEGIIEFVSETKAEKIKNKIAKLQKEIDELKTQL